MEQYIRNSAFYRLFAWLRGLFVSLSAGSALMRCGASVAARFGAVWDGSLSKRALLGSGLEDALEGSFTGKIMNAPDRASRWLGRKFGGAAAASLFLRVFRPEYGLFALAFALPFVPTMAVLAAGVVTVVAYAAQWLFGRVRCAVTVADMFVVMFAALIVRAVPVSYDAGGSVPVAAVYILFILLYIVTRNVIDTRRKLFWLAACVVASGTLVALYGVWQKFAGYVSAEMWLDSDMFESLSGRVYSTLENPNVLGEYLIIIMAMLAAALYYVKNWAGKGLCLAALGISGYCMILTLSRGAWLGLMFAVVLFALINDRRLVWVGLALLIVSPLVMPRSILERFLSIGNVEDTSTSYRVFIWLASLVMLKRFWPVGIGLGEPAFVLIYGMFSYNAVWAPHSHNLFLQTAITLGALGLIILLGMIFTAFSAMLRARGRTKDKFSRVFAGGVIAGVSGFLLQGMTDNVWYNYRVTCFFWVVLGMGMAVIGFKDELKGDKGLEAD